MKQLLLIMGITLGVLIAAGCLSNEKSAEPAQDLENNAASANTTGVRYVELQMIDGSKIGGEYVSESAAFVTIIPLYLINKDGMMVRGSGKPFGIKTGLTNAMVEIDNPGALVNSTIAEQTRQAEELAAAQAKEEERKAEEYRLAAEKRAAENAKSQPTGKNND